jgi:hypothetical protein
MQPRGDVVLVPGYGVSHAEDPTSNPVEVAGLHEPRDVIPIQIETRGLSGGDISALLRGGLEHCVEGLVSVHLLNNMRLVGRGPKKRILFCGQRREEMAGEGFEPSKA